MERRDPCRDLDSWLDPSEEKSLSEPTPPGPLAALEPPDSGRQVRVHVEVRRRSDVIRFLQGPLQFPEGRPVIRLPNGEEMVIDYTTDRVTVYIKF